MNITAKALIYNRAGDILVLYRSQTHPNFPHHLDLPGGIVENGEDPAETVRREIFEETGIKADLSSLQLVYTNDLDDDTKHLIFILRLPYDHTDVTLSWEHESYVWMGLQSLLELKVPNNIEPYHKTVLDYLGVSKSDD